MKQTSKTAQKTVSLKISGVTPALKKTGKELQLRQNAEQHHVPAGQNRKTLEQLDRLLSKVNAEQHRAILTTDTVTKLLENTLRVNVAPLILYQGPPYVYPLEVSKYFASKDVMQRDIRIEVPFNKAGVTKTLLFARSWIAMDELDAEFRKSLHAGKQTIGQIIRERRFTIAYKNLGYKEVRSAELAAYFKTRRSVHLIQRTRMICRKKRPVILIHEYVPV